MSVLWGPMAGGGGGGFRGKPSKYDTICTKFSTSFTPHRATTFGGSYILFLSFSYLTIIKTSRNGGRGKVEKEKWFFLFFGTIG